MLRGLYIATAGMRVQQLKQNNIADGITNVDTPGYKTRYVRLKSFPQILLHEKGKGRAIGTLDTGVAADDLVYSFEPGNVEKTGQDNHLAIQGDGFIEVRDTQGETFYTRNGIMKVEDGYLLTSSGYNVIDNEGQPVKVEGELVINPEGIVKGSKQQISVVTFNDYGLIKEKGSGLWQSPQNNVETVLTPNIQQGYIEKSNVDITQSMADMIASLRAYQFNSRALQAIDSTLQRAVTEIGKV